MASKSQAATKAALDAMNALANGGTITFRTGTPPANADAAATGTLLGTLILSGTAFNPATTASPSVATLAGVPLTVAAAADGTPTYARVVTSASGTVYQLTVGAGQEITFDNYTWVSGGTISLTGLTVNLAV
jgi:hypothetical protein